MNKLRLAEFETLQLRIEIGDPFPLPVHRIEEPKVSRVGGVLYGQSKHTRRCAHVPNGLLTSSHYGELLFSNGVAVNRFIVGLVVDGTEENRRSVGTPQRVTNLVLD